jgi:LmbE family N-acetylglucosaminyl deacetylase
MPTALAFSPHLDDAAFSCGGLMALLADAGWQVCMATAFTATVLPVQGFALACQLDKGLPPEVDYMALRRAEDLDAAAILDVAVRHLGHPEAPHRGYGSATALFGAVREDDDVWRPLAAVINELVDELRPALVLAPQGLGGHVDHRQMIRAVLETLPAGQVTWYRDTPYAIRDPAAAPDPALPLLPPASTLLLDAQLDRKVAASCAYRSQVGLQFGGPEAAGAALRRFAAAEGASAGKGAPAERFLGTLPREEDFAVLPGTGHSAATL